MTKPLEPALAAAATEARAWPFEEARRIIKRLETIKGGKDKTVIFETGYGPSGLPHIGTFGEVARTAMVRHAFEVLTEGKRKTRLICFSDDMDGLRKVPDNVPNKDMLAAFLDKPLTSVPDPFSNEYPSFAHHNNARLRRFLDQFGFEYEFMSATETYKAGLFDETLLKMLKTYDKVMDIILPTLGPERRATYSPFLPVSPTSGKVLQVPMVERHPRKGTVVYLDPDTGKKVETAVTGGAVKCQWKADWALRWTALGIDYEMCGKDLIDSVTLSSKICRALGGTPPENLVYELFLDDKGGKISKSKGNGLTIEEWLTYASPESLSLFMFQKPKAAKRLYFDVIPRTVDEYLQFLAAYPRQDAKGQIDNAVWHIHAGAPPAAELPISFGLLLNLVAASNADDKDVLWGFIRRHAPGAGPETHPLLDKLAGYAVRYYEDFVKPQKKFRPADEVEAQALRALADALGKVPADAKAEDLQTVIYDVGRTIPRYQDFNAKGATPDKPGVSNAWFGAIYQVLLGEERGPRFGSFVELYGVENTRALIGKALKGELASANDKRGEKSASEVPREEVRIVIDDAVSDRVARHCVGFIKFGVKPEIVEGKERRFQTGAPAGTGTLVKLGQIYGVLTAGHVLRDLRKDEIVGLVRFPNKQPPLQNYRIDFSLTDRIVDWNNKEGGAPDIAFLKIPAVEAQKLEDFDALFYNLDRLRAPKVSQPGNRMSKCYAVVGVVGEWTVEKKASLKEGRTFDFGGLFGAANNLKEFEENNTKLVEVTIDHAAGPKVPKSYGGVSGGALWELYVEIDEHKKPVNTSPRLFGVAFRQSEDHKRITSNALSSIESMKEKIKNKWPNEMG